MEMKTCARNENDVIFFHVVVAGKMFEFCATSACCVANESVVFKCHLLGDLFMANCIGSFDLADIVHTR